LRKAALSGSGAGSGTGVSGTGTDTRIDVPKRGIGRRFGAGVAGILIALFGLILVGSGYEQGPKKAADGTPGTVTIEHCDQYGRRSHRVQCSGTFRTDDRRLRYEAEDVKADSDYEKGEQVPAVATDLGNVDFGTPTFFYIDGVRVWCLAALMFGIALVPLNYTFRPVRRPMGSGMMLTILILIIGGLLGCGLCALVNSWLI
jgi:hypothetical protein